MIRTASSLALVLVLSVGFSQDSRIIERETEEMKNNATQRVELVEKTVGALSAEQRTEVMDVYMHVEHQMDMMKQRYASEPPESYEADMVHMNRTIDQQVDQKLQGILNENQMVKWSEAFRTE